MAHHHPNPSFNGLNDDQVSRIFARITCTASLVAELSREHATTAGNTAHKTTFQALDALVSSLGAMAEMPANAGHIGDLAAWTVGPPVHSGQSAQQSGDRPPPTRFNGLSDTQLSQLLLNIATSTDLLAETCSESGANAGLAPAALHFHALEYMLSTMGALADMALCSPVKDHFTAWTLGPLFHGETGAAPAAPPPQ